MRLPQQAVACAQLQGAVDLGEGQLVQPEGKPATVRLQHRFLRAPQAQEGRLAGLDRQRGQPVGFTACKEATRKREGTRPGFDALKIGADVHPFAHCDQQALPAMTPADIPPTLQSAQSGPAQDIAYQRHCGRLAAQHAGKPNACQGLCRLAMLEVPPSVMDGGWQRWRQRQHADEGRVARVATAA